MVGSLIYYKDTHDFYEKHYDEIEEIRDELTEQGIEVCIPSKNDIKNFFAWMSFEERAKNLYDELYVGR